MQKECRVNISHKYISQKKTRRKTKGLIKKIRVLGMIESGLFTFLSRLGIHMDQNKGFLPVLYSKVFWA